MKYALLILLFSLTSCFSRQPVMTADCFEQIRIGDQITSWEKKVGEPYNETSLCGGQKELEYIERIGVNSSKLVNATHYYIILDSEGRVCAKRIKHERRPLYELYYQGGRPYDSF